MKHDFKVNDGVSFGYGADCYPGTVVKVTPSRVYVTEDGHYCTKPPSAVGAHDAEHVFTQRTDEPKLIFTVKEDGRVTPYDETDCALHHGRKYWMDPSF